jgi:methionyl-tRNA formyltransferase
MVSKYQGVKVSKIVFFGTSKFAVSALKRLKDSGCSVVAVVTQPDKKGGRNLKVITSPVKMEAQRLNIPVYQPLSITEEGFVDKLKSSKADFFVVVSFGTILPAEILEIPKSCCLNIHASLLPRYRGAAPVRWALINGEKKTGVTIIKMNEKLDAGDIVLRKELKIEEADTSEILDNKLAGIGAELLIEAIGLTMNGKAKFIKQNEKEATFAPRLTKEDGKLDWKLGSDSILNRINGLKPWPGTYSFLEGGLLKIIAAKKVLRKDSSKFTPGEIIAADKEGLIIKTGDSAISILELQLEGKKRMSAELFLRGHKIKPGLKLG